MPVSYTHLVLSQLCPVHRINYSENADFLIDGTYNVNVCREGERSRNRREGIVMEDMAERGKGNIIPLWLAGFVY